MVGNMFGEMVMVRVNTSQNLNPDPDPIINNVLQKVTILLLTMFTILPEPHQKSGRTLIIYCTFCKYVIVICRSYTSRPTCYYVLVFFILHHDVRMYDFYGPTVPEINYSILFLTLTHKTG